MLAQNNKNIESKFFEFENLKSINDCVVKMHKGWNKSIVIKFCMKKENSINNLLIKKNFPSLINKEKIIVVTSGVIEIKKNNKKLIMKKFDALNFSSDEKNYEIKCSQESDFYLISCEILPEKNFDTVHFNFKKDIIAKDIWGGQCISRPYEGRDLNLVMFDLKSGFKFDDKGHYNEQITWLINGNMDFYCNNLKSKLTEINGVDIGPNHPHGGISNGAIGFDAFFPKRDGSEYKQTVRTNKF